MTESTGPYEGGSLSRLDRIEAILANVAESQQRAHQQHNLEMAEIRAGLRETRAIADGNARAVAGWSSRIEEGIAETEEIATQTRQDLSEQIGSQSERIERVERQAEDDWTRFDQRHEEHAQRFNTLLEEARADRQEWRQKFNEQQQGWQQTFDEQQQDWQQRFDEQQQGWQQRFDEQIAEMREAREANQAEHRAFTQNIQTLLAEIARLWQRLA